MHRPLPCCAWRLPESGNISLGAKEPATRLKGENRLPRPSRIPAWPALVCLIVIALVPLLFALSRLEVSTTTHDLIGPDSAEARFEQKIRARFPQDANLIALFAGPDLFEDHFLDRLDKLIEARQLALPGAQVLSLSNFERVRGGDGEFLIEALLEPDQRAGLSAEQRRELVLADTGAVRHLVSERGDMIALLILPAVVGDSRQRVQMIDELRADIRSLELDGHLAGMTGSIALNVAATEAVWFDIRALGPLSLGLGLLLMLWMFRRPLAILALIATMSAALGTALCITLARGFPFTMVTAILIPLLMALSVALLVHWFNALAYHANAGRRGRERVEAAHADVHRPALFTSLTTAAAFLSLSTSPDPVRLFGQSVAAAVIVQYLCVMWLLPALLVRWDAGSWPDTGRGLGRIGRPIVRLALLSMRQIGLVIALMLLFLLLAIPLVQRVHMDAQVLSFLPAQHPVVLSTELFNSEFHGYTSVEIILTGAERDHLIQTAQLQRIAELQDWASAQPEVDQALSLIDLIEDIHWAFNDEDPAFRRLPEDDALIAQYLLVYDGEVLDKYIDRERRMARILLLTTIYSSAQMRSFLERLNPILATIKAEGLAAEVTGEAYLLAINEQRILSGQLRGLIVASLTILLLLALLWRSLPAALLCMLPNLFPVMLVLVILGALGMPLNAITAMITAIILGLSVDDTIHLYHGYQRRRNLGHGRVWSVVYSYRRAGRAVTATTAILTGVLLVLTLSRFGPTMEFGLLTGAGIFAAWLFDVLALPALIALVARWRCFEAGPSDHEPVTRPH